MMDDDKIAGILKEGDGDGDDDYDDDDSDDDAVQKRWDVMTVKTNTGM